MLNKILVDGPFALNSTLFILVLKARLISNHSRSHTPYTYNVYYLPHADVYNTLPSLPPDKLARLGFNQLNHALV